MSSKSLYLYDRDLSYIPRIAAVHDLCGYGKCSLGVAIPVLSCAGCDVCPVPTSLFSAHTKYDHFYMHDTTEILNPYLDAWKIEGVDIDAIYSGFLGSSAQVDAILRLYQEYPKALRIVDPVMGDEGKRYPTYTEELCEAMKGLVNGAHLLTPNLTEASILTGIAYEGQQVSEEYAYKMCEALLDLGAQNVVLKGVQTAHQTIENYIASQNQPIIKTTINKIPYLLHGTGDLYCSSLLGAIMCGANLYDSVTFANEFVVAAMVNTVYQPDFEMRGVSFESVLSLMTNFYEDSFIDLSGLLEDDDEDF